MLRPPFSFSFFLTDDSNSTKVRTMTYQEKAAELVDFALSGQREEVGAYLADLEPLTAAYYTAEILAQMDAYDRPHFLEWLRSLQD
jgi:hypothetical protein